MAKKKKLTQDQEFAIMTLVLDKFLWAGLFILLYGFYVAVQGVAIQTGFWIMGAGAVLLIIFTALLLKEYELLK